MADEPTTGGPDEPDAEQAEVQVETVSFAVEFDALNLSVEDVAAVQENVLNELISRAAAVQESRRAAAEPELRLPIPLPIPLPGGGFSKHSKTHSKTRGLAEEEAAAARPRPPHSKAYSKSHSKHTKIIIG
jgi:hypothetical protein